VGVLLHYSLALSCEGTRAGFHVDPAFLLTAYLALVTLAVNAQKVSTLVHSYPLMTDFLVAQVTAHFAIHSLHDNWSELLVGQLVRIAWT